MDQINRIAGFDIDPQTVERIADSVARFEQWLASRFDLNGIHRELPLLGADASGSVVSGTADLVVETPNGLWIIDHKSDRIDSPADAFRFYRAQLDSYAAVLRGSGKTLKGVGINWLMDETVTIIQTP